MRIFLPTPFCCLFCSRICNTPCIAPPFISLILQGNQCRSLAHVDRRQWYVFFQRSSPYVPCRNRYAQAPSWNFYPPGWRPVCSPLDLPYFSLPPSLVFHFFFSRGRGRTSVALPLLLFPFYNPPRTASLRASTLYFFGYER